MLLTELALNDQTKEAPAARLMKQVQKASKLAARTIKAWAVDPPAQAATHAERHASLHLSLKPPWAMVIKRH